MQSLVWGLMFTFAATGVVALPTQYIVFAGPMGAGKTHITNNLAGREGSQRLLEGDGSTGVTRAPAYLTTSAKSSAGNPIGLIDTVGFDDNAQEDGFSLSLIETLQAMEGKMVCKMVLVALCHGRLENSVARSMDALVELTGFHPVVLQNDRSGATDCTKLQHPRFAAFAPASTIKSPSDIPGPMNCRTIVLPPEWESKVRSRDYAFVRSVVEDFKRLQCDSVQASLATLVNAPQPPAPVRPALKLKDRSCSYCARHDVKCSGFLIFESCNEYCAEYKERQSCVDQLKMENDEVKAAHAENMAMYLADKEAHDARVKDAQASQAELQGLLKRCAELVGVTSDQLRVEL